MSGWSPKRFWDSVVVSRGDTGWLVHLDGRLLRTPAKRPLEVPTSAMAAAIAEEWREVVDLIVPDRMPVTRAANAAIDRVCLHHEEVVQMVAAYGATDCLCYRAVEPETLYQAQAAAWDPLLDWAAAAFDAQLLTTRGIIPVEQPRAALLALEAEVRAATPFQLVALYDLVGLTGSLVIGLAAAKEAFDPEALWKLSRIDETWQSTQWGDDSEAAERAEYRRQEFHHARRFWRLSSTV